MNQFYFPFLIRNVRGKAYAKKSGGITSNLYKLIYNHSKNGILNKPIRRKLIFHLKFPNSPLIGC